MYDSTKGQAIWLLIILHNFVRSNMDKQKVHFEDLGVKNYKESWDYQESLLKINVQIKSARWKNSAEQESIALLNETTHSLLFVEHPPVYTLGKSGKAEHILISSAEMELGRIAFFNTNRGGDITFHGPGQLVVYPILDLEKFHADIGKYLRNLEEVVIRTLADYGISGSRSAGETGVWIEPGIAGKERKICAIGIRCSRWITMHGFALNVNTDLHYFDNIIPCGIQYKKVTSLEKEIFAAELV